MAALVENVGFIRYQRDLVMLRYHFSKLSDDQRKEMAEGKVTEGNPHHARAWARWVADYDLPEYRVQRVHRGAAQEFMRALGKKRVPNWVLTLAPFEEIQDVAREAEAVNK